MTAGIPQCCKISLSGEQPPLQINFRYMQGKRPDLKVFVSSKVNEPSEDNHEEKEDWPKRIIWQGEKGPKSNLKTFRSPFLYLTLISRAGAKVVLTTHF